MDGEKDILDEMHDAVLSFCEQCCPETCIDEMCPGCDCSMFDECYYEEDDYSYEDGDDLLYIAEDECIDEDCYPSWYAEGD